MKTAIPSVNSGNGDVDRFAEAVKQNLDSMTGQQKNAIKLLPLAATATTAEQIARLNALLDRIQG
jgi:hypothetical protein